MHKNKYCNVLKSSEIGNFIKNYLGSAKAIIIPSTALKGNCFVYFLLLQMKR